MTIVDIPHDPGERIDAKIVGDIGALERYFRVRVTDGYAPSGHAAGGEHPVGLAADIIPDTARGGTWDDVDRLAAFAAQHPGIFRFVGYDGRFGTTAWPGHGRGNHLHLSWHGGPVEGAGAPTPTLLSGKVGMLTSIAKASGRNLNSGADLSGLVVSPAAGVIGQVAGAAAGAVKDTVEFATDPIGWLWDQGKKPLLTIVLVFSALTLAGVGVARMTGVRAPIPGAKP